MALTQGTLTPMNKIVASREVAHGVRPLIKSTQGNETGRRSLLSFSLVLTASIPEANDSKKALLQDYIKRSKENKAKNDKERLDDYYKRNYKDYFELVEGAVKGKGEESLSETEKGIRKWLETNK